ncbi:lycopene cyclase domain-containing protein [Longibacter salinarum]|nr:lycopene cyclase domain-containing protein [Longibacter salinarum]
MFHFVFTLPVIIGLAATLPRPLGGVGGRRGRWAIPLLCVIAFSYTTPWDNYLVANDVWWYGADRVIATIGYVPVEEYMFFLLQPVLTGLFLYHVLGRLGYADRRSGLLPHVLGAAFWLLVSGISFYHLRSGPDDAFYLSLILAWSGPVLAGMWLYDGKTLWAKRKTMLVAVGVPTLYLWFADAIAIYAGIWTISTDYTLGLKVWTLPVEEATFFLVTNLLVVKGILLFLYGSHESIQSATSKPSRADTPEMAQG